MTCYRDLVNENAPVLVPGNVTLTHNLTTVELPVPMIGNQEELDVQRIQRKTLNGDMIVHKDVDWFNIETFRFKFQTVDQTLRDAFFAFIESTLGLSVTLVDHWGREREGTITNVTEGSEEVYGKCGFTLGFDFEC